MLANILGNPATAHHFMKLNEFCNRLQNWSAGGLIQFSQ